MLFPSQLSSAEGENRFFRNIYQFAEIYFLSNQFKRPTFALPKIKLDFKVLYNGSENQDKTSVLRPQPR